MNIYLRGRVSVDVSAEPIASPEKLKKKMGIVLRVGYAKISNVVLGMGMIGAFLRGWGG